MENGEHTNGAPKVESEPGHYSQLILTLDVHPWALTISGDIASADCALAMLDQARRYFEAELRKASALQLQQQLVEQQRNAAIAAQIRGRA